MNHLRQYGMDPDTNAIRAEELEGLGDYPEPEPAHPRDTPGRSALEPALVDEGMAPVPYAEHQAALTKLREEQRAREEAVEECERLRERLGWGPYVVVKIRDLKELSGAEEVPVVIGYGQGMTTHLVTTLLGYGLQGAMQQLGETVPQQVRQGAGEDTQRLHPARGTAPGPGNYGPGQPRPRQEVRRGLEGWGEPEAPAAV